MAMLDVRGIILHFRGVAALSDVSFKVEPRTIHAIIGPNGAGKTSLLNCISGFYKPQRGTIAFDGARHLPAAPWPAPSSASPAPSRTSPCSAA